MRPSVAVVCLSALLLSAIPALSASTPAAPATPQKKDSIVIVFKDGHRQTFSLSDIERIEFPAGDQASSAGPSSPTRSRFLGKWEVGDGSGHTFYISLYDDGGAKRTLGNVHGKWEYVNGEAHITWDDGAQDALRRVGTHFQKYAYRIGKSFTDEPDNVTPARNTLSNPL